MIHPLNKFRAFLDSFLFLPLSLFFGRELEEIVSIYQENVLVSSFSAIVRLDK